MKLLLRIFIGLIILIALYLLTVIVFATLTDYRPAPVTPIEVEGNAEESVIQDSTITFLTWNIGYCGLGEEMDFFYDGGKNIHPKPELLGKYTRGILNFLATADSIDFFLLQEIDKRSRRSKFQDETEMVRSSLPGKAACFGTNYKVQFVPIPLLHPLGKIEMGQMTLSEYQPITATRHAYYSAYEWPKRLFMLDRCFILSRYSLPNNKNLVVLNTHNSAYDKDGKLRKTEMPLIVNIMQEEYEKGNYVVAGGDWNQNPPDYNTASLKKYFPAVAREIMPDSLLSSGWKVCYDKYLPTNREIDAPLTPGKTEVTIIDFFILSPNIEMKMIEVKRQDFQFSDHEPVFMKVKLL
ncbi:MAG: endonuclease [Draconibacterium sp.]|nr:MAG: endonuclease [Draconibacterium sp.]